MKVYEALASAVALEGTEVVFTLMDSFTEDLMSSSRRSGASGPLRHATSREPF